MIKYDKYKSSGIDWLGDIPNDWEVKRVKDVSKINEKAINEKVDKNYQFRYVDIGNVNQNGIINEPEIITFFEAPSRARRIVRENDIIVSTVRTYLKAVAFINFVPNDYIVSTGFAVLTPNNKTLPKYLAFYSQSETFIDLVIRFSTGVSYPAINSSTISDICIIQPPLKSQTLIANYLDTKTQAIDKKINLLTQKANYYKEYRKSLINEAVCKGLDKNVKSKITELGFNVNENYSFFRLKDLGYLYSGLSGKAGEDFNQDENPNNKGFIPFTNIANNIYLKKDHLGTVVVYDNENQNKVKKEDVFFLMSSEGYEDIGKSAILDDELEETYLNSFCKGYRVTNRKANPYFLNYLLLSDNYRKQLTVEGKGFTRINLKMEKVNDFIVFIPNTIDEQKKIVSFLDDKTQTIDKIVSNINAQIATLKELRKSLINDAVTGKIKVTSN